MIDATAVAMLFDQLEAEWAAYKKLFYGKASWNKVNAYGKINVDPIFYMISWLVPPGIWIDQIYDGFA